MPLYTKDSLETLRNRIDLLEVLTPYMELKRSGATYKGLCPFHDEKSPSFMVQKGDHHYHCFGCGAHGDAIQFMMNFVKLSFSDAVEQLAEKFHVHLEPLERGQEYQGPSKRVMKEALVYAERFYHFVLLHTHEGHDALRYLYQRGIDLDFIRQFHLGLAPREPGIFRKAMYEKGFFDDILIAAGLAVQRDTGKVRDFFYDRITFPIHEPSGATIGFSARKYKEETFGGKYVNTGETPLFKKSKVLFGLDYSRRRIAKEQQAIIVEGQIDALRLIHEGFDFTVAGQGTAFGDGHAKELVNLGVSCVYLAMDADGAGMEAAAKIGDLFQKLGIDVRVVALPAGKDPDGFLIERGPEKFKYMMEKSADYISFLVEYRSRGQDLSSPAVKNQVVQALTKQVRGWDESIMVHESLRKVAQLLKIPEEMIGVGVDHTPNLYIRKSDTVGMQTVDPYRVLESDFLRWMLLSGKDPAGFLEAAKANLTAEDFFNPICKKVYKLYMEKIERGESRDLLTLSIELGDIDVQELLAELTQKRINTEKAEQHFHETIKKILDRNWMEKREKISRELQSGRCSDDEALALAKEFQILKSNPPILHLGIEASS